MFDEVSSINSLGYISSVAEDNWGKDNEQTAYPDEGLRSSGLCKRKLTL